MDAITIELGQVGCEETIPFHDIPDEFFASAPSVSIPEEEADNFPY